MPGTPETNPDKEYFRSDYKQRGKGVWQHLSTLDKGGSQTVRGSASFEVCTR